MKMITSERVLNGDVAERPKALAWKAGEGQSLPQVRILPSPLRIQVLIEGEVNLVGLPNAWC